MYLKINVPVSVPLKAAKAGIGAGAGIEAGAGSRTATVGHFDDHKCCRGRYPMRGDVYHGEDTQGCDEGVVCHA